jgi:hypothetical protein
MLIDRKLAAVIPVVNRRIGKPSIMVSSGMIFQIRRRIPESAGSSADVDVFRISISSSVQ